MFFWGPVTKEEREEARKIVHLWKDEHSGWGFYDSWCGMTYSTSQPYEYVDLSKVTCPNCLYYKSKGKAVKKIGF